MGSISSPWSLRSTGRRGCFRRHVLTSWGLSKWSYLRTQARTCPQCFELEQEIMRTLWILNHYAAPPMGRHQALAAALVHHGWNTCILAASTSRPPDIHATSTELDGVSCRWGRASGYSANGAGRVANTFTHTANSTALVVARNGLPRPDVVWGSTVHPGAPVAGLAVARRFKTPFIYTKLARQSAILDYMRRPRQR